MSAPRWNAEKDAILRQLWPDAATPREEIAARTGHTIDGCRSRALALKLNRRNRLHAPNEIAKQRWEGTLAMLRAAVDEQRPCPRSSEIAAAIGASQHEARRIIERMAKAGVITVRTVQNNTRIIGIGGRETASPEDVCLHGHPLTPSNTYRTKDGWVRCLDCRRISDQAYEAKRRERQKAKAEAPPVIELLHGHWPVAAPARVAPLTREAEQRAIEEAIAAGKVTHCPPAYLNPIAGAKPLSVLTHQPRSKAEIAAARVQAARRGRINALKRRA